MNAKQRMEPSSSIEQQLRAIGIFERQHNAALHDARVARIRLFIDAIVWVCGNLKRAGSDVFATPSPKC